MWLKISFCVLFGLAFLDYIFPFRTNSRATHSKSPQPKTTKAPQTTKSPPTTKTPPTTKPPQTKPPQTTKSPQTKPTTPTPVITLPHRNYTVKRRRWNKAKLSCIKRAITCTERRIQKHLSKREIIPVFQDALYHYCLNLFKCKEGKELACHNVGRNEQDYPDPSLRIKLVRQCNKWKIPIQLSKTGDLNAHFVFFHKRNPPRRS